MSIQSMKASLIKTTALVALSVAVIGGSGLAAPKAEAGHKHKHWGHVAVGVALAAPLVHGSYGYYGYHANRHCYWMYRKAMETGSKYWWNRFNECRYGDDD